MFKKISLFYFLVCVFMCKETYASSINDNTKIESLLQKIKSLQTKTEKHKYESTFYFFLGNFYITTGLLNFNNIDWEYIFFEKWDLKLGLYWGIANLGLGLRINDSLLIRIIGLNLLEPILISYASFYFHKNKDGNEGKTSSKKHITMKTNKKAILNITEDLNSDSQDDEYFEEPYTANREIIKGTYIDVLPLVSLFNFMSIEIKIAEYWRFNINFTQPIIISLIDL